jgi:acyl-CoA reductase-like NAD-dependent aldehyde dehydrogenase
MKQSGYGRVGGVEGLLEHTNVKVIVLPSPAA